MIKLHITKTRKTYSPKDPYRIMYEESESFKSLYEAKEWLKSTYGKCKRVKMYRDTKNGSIHIGYVYCFKDEQFLDPNSRAIIKLLAQDWVEFQEIKPVVLS